ncbi:hypothetical protein BJ912DRAFT_1052060 [Pholiota molesta]|nr:hypothetical protein BJ912DRAFT_1052060 [Pholiota molesta]
MARALARDYGQAITRPRRASAASVKPDANKNFACGYCEKHFGRKGDCKRHESLHLGVKNHKCHICEKTFSQNSGLKTHLNTHTGDKPYRCEYEGCEAKFGDPSSWNRHEKEKHKMVDFRYKCPVEKCTSGIKRPSAFAAHLKVKHNIVATSKQRDDMKEFIGSKPTLSQRRKASNVDHGRSLALACAESTDSVHLNRSVAPPHLSTAATLEQIWPALDALQHQEPGETQFYFLPDQSPSDIQSLFSTPILSSSLSAFSAQSSTESLVAEDFNYEDYTHAKMSYADVADHTQSLNPAVSLIPSSSPPPRTPKAPPFGKDVYRPSPPSMHPGPQDHIWINAQMAYDRQRYVPNMDESHYLLDHKSYIMPQAQEKDLGYSFPQLDLAQQTSSQPWHWFS